MCQAYGDVQKKLAPLIAVQCGSTGYWRFVVITYAHRFFIYFCYYFLFVSQFKKMCCIFKVVDMLGTSNNTIPPKST